MMRSGRSAWPVALGSFFYCVLVLVLLVPPPPNGRVVAWAPPTPSPLPHHRRLRTTTTTAASPIVAVGRGNGGTHIRLWGKRPHRRSNDKHQNHNHPRPSKPPAAPTQTQTWRVFNVEVHPDDLMLDLAQERKLQARHTHLSEKTPTPASTTTTTTTNVAKAMNDVDYGRRASIDSAVQAQFLHPAVMAALRRRLRLSPMKTTNSTSYSDDDITPPVSDDLDGRVRVVRRSLDARPKAHRQDQRSGPRFVYVLDVDVSPQQAASASLRHLLRHQPGKMECLKSPPPTTAGNKVDEDKSHDNLTKTNNEDNNNTNCKTKRVVIVGAGPAGLFCALRLLAWGDDHNRIVPILLERGQPVERRGQDIGALMHRRVMQKDSNYAFGEGGAGTWSDGKLTTRIGRNAAAVRTVLETFVKYGAPARILLDGAPHLGTDNLVRLLRNMRFALRQQGGQVHFGTRVTGLIVDDERVVRGVQYDHEPAMERHAHVDEALSAVEDKLEASGSLYADAVVLATGHSARDIYEQLHAQGVELQAKGFAVGFRIEHPQKLINKIQYGSEWGPSVVTGKQTTDQANEHFFRGNTHSEGEQESHEERHPGHLPVPSYRLATNKAFDGSKYRGVYSFCMCPGGQIVPASTDPDEVCVNGMSFSRRDSQWANSALVVTVDADDPILQPYRESHGVLAGMAFQKAMERKAAVLGGGNLRVPVQRVTDFLAGVDPSCTSTPGGLPSSSYRLGVTAAPCHTIYPAALTAALRNALTDYFDAQMPGYVSPNGLLHGVETRTSSPLRVCRDDTTLQATGVQGLFPAGEGAGFAGGIVSAAVDGGVVAEALIACIGEGDGGNIARSSKVNRKSYWASNNAGTFY